MRGGGDLVQVLELGRLVVPDHLHGFERRLVEVGRLAVHHLNHHDAQGPDVHLPSGSTHPQGTGSERGTLREV